MNTQKIFIGGLVLALLLGLYGSFRSVTGTPGQNGANGANGQSLGATATLDGVDNPYVSINGQKEFHFTQNFTATSSVICAVKNPYGATSTVDSFSARTTSALAGAAANIFSLSTTSITDVNGRGYGSSSPALLLDHSVVASSVNNFASWTPSNIASTSLLVTQNKLYVAVGEASGENLVILGPNDWLTYRLASSAPSAFTTYAAGVCTGVIRKL